MASAGEQLLARLGYGPNIITPDWIKDISNQLGEYVAGGGLSMDDALIELRTQIEGRRAGTGGYSNITQEATGTSDTVPSQSYALVESLIKLGVPPATAAMLVSTDPLGALRFLSEQSGSGSGGRTQFASEAALDEQQTRLAAANAAQQEWQNSILSSGSRLTMGPNGLLIDQITGQTVDPTSLGLARDQFKFQSGPQFQEGIRQFDQSNATDLRGQDINLALGNLNAQNTAQRNAADAAIGFGNLGVARTDQIRGILSNPSDALARLYSQRGGQSPTAFISQADLLNAFNNQIKGIENQYQSQLSAFKPATVGGGVPIVPSKLTPPPVTAPVNQYPDFNSTTEDPGGFTNPASDTYQNDGWYEPGAEQQALMTQDVDPGGSYGIQEALQMLQEEANSNRHATGGYTQDKVFLGNEKGSELFINPTGAPITIVPHNKTSKLMNADINGYDEGTPSAGIQTRLQPRPTGGFMNSLREVIEGAVRDIADMQKAPASTPEQQTQYETRLKSAIKVIKELSPKDKEGIQGYAEGTISNIPTGYYNLSNYMGGFAPSGDVTQGELNSLADQALAPGGRSVIQGTRLEPFNIQGLQTPTLRSFNNLSGAEKQNLNTYLATKFNSTIDDLMHQLGQRYGTNTSRMARFRG